MTAFLFIAAALTGMWFLLALAIGENHPAPSQTSIIPQIIVSAALTLLFFLAGVVAVTISFFGG